MLKTDNAAIEQLFVSNLRMNLHANGLLDYAVPRLVRITASIGATGTYKQVKNDFVRRN